MIAKHFLYPSEQDIRSLLKRIRGAKVGVLGDFCVDAYWGIDSKVKEISVETGKSIHHIRQQRYSPGGAGNVVVNLRALGVEQVEVFGVVGPDPFGPKLLQMMDQLGVTTAGMLVQAEEWDTPVYGKPLLDGVELERMDFGAFNVLHAETWERLLAALKAAQNRLDFLIINEQLPRGWGSEARATALNRELQANWKAKHLVDTRDYVQCFRGATQKLNEYEAARMVGRKMELSDVLGEEESLALARQASSQDAELLFMTSGSRGVTVCHQGDVSTIPGVLILGPTDTVGAGDTITATLAACLASGLDPVQGACLANLAASITVQKINQTGTASESELVATAKTVAYLFHSGLAEEVRRAGYFEKTDFEIVDPMPLEPTRFALFDHDGTISTLRQGWEPVMEPVMIRAILGESFATVESSVFHRIQTRVRAFIEQSTGIQTLRQMDGLVSMVSEFNFVPEARRLDAQGYKDVYNAALISMVNDRVARLQRGELLASDFILKGAVEFLQALRQKGITLYLASGTDEADAIKEARVLGYLDLFDGGVVGAKPGSRSCSKERVIESVLKGGDRQKSGFLVVGDGPVEIQQACRYGGFALGVASNEERRFGLNAAKRRRLIRAGAHAVVPDFSQWPQWIGQVIRTS
jgi:rfaE bifunctional protein kinase chain/domain